MRLAILSPLAIFPAHGGSYARLRDLSAHLMECGHEVDFVYMPPRVQRPWDRAAHEHVFGAGFHELRRTLLGDSAYLARRAAAIAWRRLQGSAGLRMDGVDDIYYRPFSRHIAALDRRRRYDAAIAVYAYSSRALEALGGDCFRIIDTLDSVAGEIPASEERRGLARADAILAIQEAEAEAFRTLLKGDAAKVHIVSHMPPARPALSVASTAGATFVGSAFDANRSALRYFVEHVLPMILAEQPDFKLVVAGSISADAPAHSAIRRLGAVDDIAAAYAQAPIALNPVLSGTGVKIKLLDALALGVPAVSTAFGVTGIPNDARGGIIVVPDTSAQDFAAAVLRLFRDAEYRSKMAAAAASGSRAWTAAQKSSLGLVLAKVGAVR